jgi:hypothetical protein
MDDATHQNHTESYELKTDGSRALAFKTGEMPVPRRSPRRDWR